MGSPGKERKLTDQLRLGATSLLKGQERRFLLPGAESTSINSDLGPDNTLSGRISTYFPPLPLSPRWAYLLSAAQAEELRKVFFNSHADVNFVPSSRSSSPILFWQYTREIPAPQYCFALTLSPPPSLLSSSPCLPPPQISAEPETFFLLPGNQFERKRNVAGLLPRLLEIQGHLHPGKKMKPSDPGSRRCLLSLHPPWWPQSQVCFQCHPGLLAGLKAEGI